MQYATLREKIAAEKGERAARYERFTAALAEARTAGGNAALAVTPTPMIVRGRDGGLVEVVKDGACGFGWVSVRPGGSSFARWLVKEGHAHRDSYSGGVTIHPGLNTQSLERVTAWANAAADVLRDRLGVEAYGQSRID